MLFEITLKFLVSWFNKINYEKWIKVLLKVLPKLRKKENKKRGNMIVHKEKKAGE